MTAARERNEGAERAEYLTEVCELLWPEPARARVCRRHASSAGQPDSEFLVVPTSRRPRLVVPRDRRAGAAALRGYGEAGSAQTRLATGALRVMLASGLGAIVLRDRLVVRAPPGSQTIESYLGAVLGRSVLISTHLTAARANRKPVLQVLTADGETVCYAKIGTNDLTSALVRSEHAALTRLASSRLTAIQVPKVLASGRWQGMEILLLAPLPVWRRRTPLRPGQLTAAMAELAAAQRTESAPLAASRYWQRLQARLRDAPAGAERTALLTALERTAARAGDLPPLGYGAWHGDWTPWNMASIAGSLLVWDWERFSADTPVGFDALHYWLQERVVPGRQDPAQAAADCVRRAPEILAPWGIGQPVASLTAIAYLAELSVRYLSDRQEQAGARLGAPGKWLIPAITRAVGER